MQLPVVLTAEAVAALPVAALGIDATATPGCAVFSLYLRPAG